MLAPKIVAHENGFISTKKDTNGTVFNITEKSYGSDGYTLNVKSLEPIGVTDYFYPGKTKKQGIVLHFTAGYLRGDIAMMVRQGKHVSVPYVVARSGDIFEVFESNSNWAYHLGEGAIGGNTIMSKATIGIEISNIGPLELKDGNLHTVYGDKYCTLNQSQYYIKLDNAWRGYEYFASYTEEQIDSIADIIKKEASVNDIPIAFLPEDKRYKTFSTPSESKAFKGISTHINYRKSGKWDIGPAFPWDSLISKLTEAPEQEIVLPEVEVKAEPVKPVKPAKTPTKAPDVMKVAPPKKTSLLEFIIGMIGKLMGR